MCSRMEPSFKLLTEVYGDIPTLDSEAYHMSNYVFGCLVDQDKHLPLQKIRIKIQKISRLQIDRLQDILYCGVPLFSLCETEVSPFIYLGESGSVQFTLLSLANIQHAIFWSLKFKDGKKDGDTSAWSFLTSKSRVVCGRYSAWEIGH